MWDGGAPGVVANDAETDRTLLYQRIKVKDNPLFLHLHPKLQIS
jgi:hypothetical protein